jgi:hypothetical protein
MWPSKVYRFAARRIVTVLVRQNRELRTGARATYEAGYDAGRRTRSLRSRAFTTVLNALDPEGK